MLSALKDAITGGSPSRSSSTTTTAQTRRPPNKPILTEYASLPLPIPPTFLTTSPSDARPITATHIDWLSTPTPEYEGHYALILDNVLSPSECASLLSLAERSVPEPLKWPDSTNPGKLTPWRPAMVNMGGGWEVLEPGYRNGERIIWDEQEVVDRVWARCLEAIETMEGGGSAKYVGKTRGGSEEVLIQVERGLEKVRGKRIGDGMEGWRFQRVNQRMRCLKYTAGGFFRPHCDAAYHETEAPDGTPVKRMTVFTVHLYLNDCKAEATDPESTELVGGATSFLSRDEKRKTNVECKAGRVLIFQHRGLLHSGDDVLAGTKYTIRTDILYEYCV